MRDIIAFIILGLSLLMLSLSVVMLLVVPVGPWNHTLLAAGCAIMFTLAIPFALWMLEKNSKPPQQNG
jgi:uncharacterized membrane protein YqjE